MRRIIDNLHEFERKNGAKIILAVESGSRGWGFSSIDSDYDVRFVYAYPKDRYIGLDTPQTSYNWTEGEYDFEGFDIHKFYDLLLKSNMNIIDWLMQDIIYIDKIKEKKELKMIVQNQFSPRIYVAHNYGLCIKNYTKYFNSPNPNEPTIKRYVYCIRALLSAMYCKKFEKIAPLKFDDLIKQTLNNAELNEMQRMIEIKKQTKEKERYHNKKWHDFIDTELKKEREKINGNDEKLKEYKKNLNRHLFLQLEGIS